MRTCWKRCVAVNSARALDQSRLTIAVILIFYQGYVARLTRLACQELLLTREEEGR